jgi:hypothetical protein
MATDWSEAAKARRSAAAKKAAETRKAKKAQLDANLAFQGRKLRAEYPYFTNSRVARWALSNVSVLAMMRCARHIRWPRPTLLMRLPYNPVVLRG